MVSSPRIAKQYRISPVWTLPILALLICGWLLFSSYQNAGVRITIYFDDATGITPGKTQVMARGIPLGLVKEIHPDLDNLRTKTVVLMNKEAARHLVEDSLFWVVRPELSAASIQGLDTIFTGSYIELQAGISKKATRTFHGLTSRPPASDSAPGLHLSLRADSLRSLQKGSGVYYRNLKIGAVQDYRLESDTNVIIDVHIDPAYSHLVKAGSRFCNASGVTVSGKLTNLKMRVESLASFLAGGIYLYTPEPLTNSPPVTSGHIFPLYKDYEAANYGIPMTLKLASGKGITEGLTKVMYRGLEAGFVQKITINDDARRTVTAHILLDPRVELILKDRTRFWVAQPDISPEGIRNIGALITGPYITFEPGEGDFKNHFEVLAEAPPQLPLRPGSQFHLTATDSQALRIGSPVLYKQIKVGEVIGLDIDDSGQRVNVTIFIYQPHVRLLGPDSVFWSISSLDLSAGTTGINVRTGPLAAILHGGIGFATPPVPPDLSMPPVQAGQTFPLFGDENQARQRLPASPQPGYHFYLTAADSGPYGIGTPLLYKKTPVGEVTGFGLSQDHKRVILNCVVDDEFRDLVTDRSRFFHISPLHMQAGLSGVTIDVGSLTSLVRGSIGFMTPPGGTHPTTPHTFPLYPSRKASQTADHIPITIQFARTHTLKVGAPIIYRGVSLGEVSHINFSEDLQSVAVEALIRPEMGTFFRESTRVWLATAEIGLNGVQNLDTLLGAYITLQPGTGKRAYSFTALDHPPQSVIGDAQGLEIVLQTKHLGSLRPRSPVYYRQVQIGEVTGYRLSETLQHVLVTLSLRRPYGPLIRENTRFWNVSGARIEGGLFSGISVSTESLQAFVAGGIALATPDNEEMGKRVGQGHLFPLYDTVQKQWLDWDPTIVVVEEEQTP